MRNTCIFPAGRTTIEDQQNQCYNFSRDDGVDRVMHEAMNLREIDDHRLFDPLSSSVYIFFPWRISALVEDIVVPNRSHEGASLLLSLLYSVATSCRYVLSTSSL